MVTLKRNCVRFITCASFCALAILLSIGISGCGGGSQQAGDGAVDATEAEDFDLSKVPESQKAGAEALQKAGAQLGQNEQGEIVIVELGPTATNETVQHLKSLATLQEVSVMEAAKVTDASVEVLKGLTNLTVLNAEDSGISSKGVKQLQAALPNCDVSGGEEEEDEEEDE